MAVFMVIADDRQRELLQVSDVLGSRGHHADFLDTETDPSAYGGDDRKNDEPARMSDQESSDGTHDFKKQELR
ncbi:MAG: hypothetical protein L0215_02425 [Gemmataceae bacterium]|nr:hypothetical protein [Gemmataceae bacterium]